MPVPRARHTTDGRTVQSGVIQRFSEGSGNAHLPGFEQCMCRLLSRNFFTKSSNQQALVRELPHWNERKPTARGHPGKGTRANGTEIRRPHFTINPVQALQSELMNIRETPRIRSVSG